MYVFTMIITIKIRTIILQIITITVMMMIFTIMIKINIVTLICNDIIIGSNTHSRIKSKKHS